MEIDPVESRARTTRRFAWTKVDAAVVRALLVAAYERADREGDLTGLRGLTDDALRGQARRTFGSPPKASLISGVADVLVERWLPTRSRSALDQLASIVQMGLSGPDRTASFATKAQLLEFFRRRRLTDTFVTNLRAAFVKAHKEVVPVKPGKGGSSPRDAVERGLAGEGVVDRREPFPHQREAWKRLDDLCEVRNPDERRGLMVLPTGAGKTYW